jgi:2-keto-4-pentenoate hydratase/2-oxohepta-3-ene-1,7-dioic acid hydratase in catechol pathway
VATSYRLAVAPLDGVETVLVERDGRFLPLADLLERAGSPLMPAQGQGGLMPLLADWRAWRGRIAEAVARGEDRFEREGLAAPERFAPPTGLPPKLLCIGANYHDHIAEMKAPITPTYPYSFLKPASTTLRGSGDTVALPRDAEMIDWEAELAVVIGQRCRDVPVATALSVVAGYTNFNDISARDCIARALPIGIDWVLHKAYDGFGPIGPFFVPAEFVPDPQALPIRLTVNDIPKQTSNTAKMVFGVAEIIAHLSSIMTLEPGDVIATGTPAGCGFGRQPQEFLKPGDRMEIEIGPLGVLRTQLA